MKNRRNLQSMARAAVYLFFGCLLVISLMVSPAAAQRQFTRFGDSNPGGFWFNVVAGLSTLFNEQIKNSNASCITTGGSTDNNRLARKHELDTWLTHSYAAYENWMGIGIFKGEAPFKNFRMLSKVYTGMPTLVVLADSNIYTLSDLKGKRVCLGGPGSGNYDTARYLLEPNGIWEHIKKQSISHAGCGRSLLDGNSDAAASAASPSAAFIEVEAQRKIRFVKVSEEEINRAVKANPFFSKGTMPGGVYKSIQEPWLVPSYRVYWAAHKDFSPDMVYQMLKVTFDPMNKTRIQAIHVSMKELEPELDVMVPMGIPLHPGAVKFWKEQGLSVPNELIPPEMKGS